MSNELDGSGMNVYATGGIVSGNGPIFIGESPEILIIPEGSHVIKLIPDAYSCDGPGCEQRGGWEANNWIRVARHAETGRFFGSERCYFCSLRCMANWLAVELAKEETKA